MVDGLSFNTRLHVNVVPIMKQFFFWCYPWDLEDEGIDAALGRMAGEIGVDAVSVAASSHCVRAFRPRLMQGPQTIRREATTHFQPAGDRYVNTRLRPSAASWMKSRNPLDKIARSAERHSLKLRAWTVCCHNAVLAARHPMATCVDVFGDAVEGWLCPSNPDVREYVAALAEDLTTNYPLDTIELDAADFGWIEHIRRHQETVFSSGDTASPFLSWCFCSSCRQRASDVDADAEAAQAAVANLLKRAMRLERPAGASFDALLAEDVHLAGYQTVRQDAVTSLVRMVRSRTRTRVVIHRRCARQVGGVDSSASSAHCDGLIAPWTTGAPAGIEGRVLEEAGGAQRVEISQSCCPPDRTNGQSLVTDVHEASQAGHERIGFVNYGLAPEPCLDWVRQAIRYARREDGA